MRHKVTISTLIFGLVIVSAMLSIVRGKETVGKYVRPNKDPLSGFNLNCGNCIWNQGESTFQVYTVPEIDSAFSSRDSSISSLSSSLTSVTRRLDSVEKQAASNDKKIDDVETRRNSQVKESIDKLPQRLLSEEAKNALKEAVLMNIRAELQQLRSDMQSQIDELKEKKKDK